MVAKNSPRIIGDEENFVDEPDANEPDTAVPTCAGSFAGRVVDAVSGAPIEDADVDYSGPSDGLSQSGADGSFVSQELPCGDYDVIIAAEGYLAASVSLEISEDGEVTQLVELHALDDSCEGEASQVVGSIVDGVTGNFVEGATVELREGPDATFSDPIFLSTDTDADASSRTFWAYRTCPGVSFRTLGAYPSGLDPQLLQHLAVAFAGPLSVVDQFVTARHIGVGWRNSIMTESEEEQLVGLLSNGQVTVHHLLQTRWLGLFARDPELRKALSRIAARLLELESGLSRAARDEDEHAEGAPCSDRVTGLTRTLRRIEPAVTRDVAWDIAEQLEIELLFVAPREKLQALLEREWTQRESRSDNPWSSLYPQDDLESLRHGDPAPGATEDRGLQASASSVRLSRWGPEWRQTVIHRLALLFERRIDSWRHDRTNAGIRSQYLVSIAVLLGLCLAATVCLSHWNSMKLTDLLEVIAAGALGSLLSGAYTLRDEALGIRQLRSLWPVVLARPVLGGVAGVSLFAILRSDLIQLGELPGDLWPGKFVVGFLAGFSEPLFISVVSRIAGMTVGPSERVR